MGGADPMRERLRELGRAQARTLDADLEARIVERVKAQGPAVIRRSRRLRALSRASAVALPLALCAAWLGWRSTATPTRDEVASKPAGGHSADSDVAHAPPAASPAASAVVAPAPPSCAERSQPQTTFSALPAGRRWIDLGERGRIVLERGGEAAFDASDPCKLQVRLAAGRVSVHAENLHGGELRVTAGSTDVVVHGTMFAVARVGEQVDVDVEEGAVGVERSGSLIAPPVRAGQQLQVRATQAPMLLALSNESRQQLRAALAAVRVDAEPPNAASGRELSSRSIALQKPAASAANLVARADELWRSGARDRARARYHEAGNAKGPTAEAAWLALARRELSIGDPTAASEALVRYSARFPNGELAAEAAGIEFRAALQARDRERTASVARTLTERYPTTPQAEAAARWLREQGARR